MNKTLAITTIALVAVVMGMSVIAPAYAALPDAVCVFRTNSNVFACTTDLTSRSINHVLFLAPGASGFACHFDKFSATSDFFAGTLAHTDKRCPFSLGSFLGFFYVVV